MSIPNPLCLEGGLGGGFEGVSTERKVRPLRVLQKRYCKLRGVCVFGGGGGAAPPKKFPVGGGGGGGRAPLKNFQFRGSEMPFPAFYAGYFQSIDMIKEKRNI